MQSMQYDWSSPSIVTAQQCNHSSAATVMEQQGQAPPIQCTAKRLQPTHHGQVPMQLKASNERKFVMLARLEELPGG